MVANAIEETPSNRTDSVAIAEFFQTLAYPGRVRRVGRVRLPLALSYRPWATLYVLPDGRPWWVVRLWEGDRPVTRVVPTSALLRFARVNGHAAVARAVAELIASAVGADALGR